MAIFDGILQQLPWEIVQTLRIKWINILIAEQLICILSGLKIREGPAAAANWVPNNVRDEERRVAAPERRVLSRLDALPRCRLSTTSGELNQMHQHTSSSCCD
jgi:hypothetical protein